MCKIEEILVEPPLVGCLAVLGGAGNLSARAGCHFWRHFLENDVAYRVIALCKRFKFCTAVYIWNNKLWPGWG